MIRYLLIECVFIARTIFKIYIVNSKNIVSRPYCISCKFDTNTAYKCSATMIPFDVMTFL